MKDITLLKNAGVVNQQIMKVVEEHFMSIYDSLGEGESLDEFTLIDTGIIVILEAGDNPYSLDEMGFESAENGLLDAIPEWVEEQELANGTLATVNILCNNYYDLTIMLKKEDFDSDIENWIEEHI